MTASAHFSHDSLQNVSTDMMQERLFTEKGINFNDLPAGFKRGRFIERVAAERATMFVDSRTGEERSATVTRNLWASVEPPIFTRDRAWLGSRIPTA